jgi:putative acetyltransferase
VAAASSGDAFHVRDERPEDAPRVFAVQRAAFGREAEARLVDALRRTVQPRLSLVAEAEGELVGHVFLSPVTIEGAAGAPACAGLAPLGVLPARQGCGAGSALVREGLARAPARGWRAVFLLGDPAYYARFGFRLAAPRGLHYESDAFDAAFQVRELAPGALAGVRGFVRYPAAFAELA